MSVRHIHARPGEYIAVHRRYRSRSRVTGGGGGDGAGCFGLLAIIFAVWLVASFWKIIVGLAVLCAAGWLIWIFRRPIRHGAFWIFTKLADLSIVNKVLQKRRGQGIWADRKNTCSREAPVMIGARRRRSKSESLF